MAYNETDYIWVYVDVRTVSPEPQRERPGTILMNSPGTFAPTLFVSTALPHGTWHYIVIPATQGDTLRGVANIVIYNQSTRMSPCKLLTQKMALFVTEVIGARSQLRHISSHWMVLREPYL